MGRTITIHDVDCATYDRLVAKADAEGKSLGAYLTEQVHLMAMMAAWSLPRDGGTTAEFIERVDRRRPGETDTSNPST